MWKPCAIGQQRNCRPRTVDDGMHSATARHQCRPCESDFHGRATRRVRRSGYAEVRTLLNSGNVLFHCARPDTVKLALSIQKAIADRCALSVATTVLTMADLAAIARGSPRLKCAAEPAKHVVAFVGHPKSLLPLRALLKLSWAPDALAVGSRACARSAADAVTTRNWATVLKILAASQSAAASR
jgi:uncharacterized protein (DUF1697 family)